MLRSGSRTSASATPRSPSGSPIFPARNSAQACRRSRSDLHFRWRRSPMADARRETWITGVGIVSCLGEGQEAHWQRLNAPPALPDLTTFAPYAVHPLAPIELDKQIPKKGDQRQMEAGRGLGPIPAAR